MCADIFSNCITCSTSTPLACQTCQTSYFVRSNGRCSQCVGNCSVCSNASSCTTCNTGYFYKQNKNKCLTCTDIFPGCITCSSFSPVTCQTCPNAYFVNSTSGCSKCVGNCTSCQDATSCDTCLTSDHFFSAITNNCLQCEDLFSNCLSCTSSSGNVQCQTCDPEYIKNISTNAIYSTACFSYCGDGVIETHE